MFRIIFPKQLTKLNQLLQIKFKGKYIITPWVYPPKL
jgi:hypothetical protein